MDELINKVTKAYSTIFPELLESYKENDDQTIVEIIADKIIDKSKNLVDVNSIRNKVKNILNKT
jgi:predicted RNA binding protein with dsRBD fold (UPF0201 family)